MKRIEFRLSMPGVASWNGKWSGSGRNYSKVRKMSDSSAKKLLGDKESKSWSHRWDDGWCAVVTASIVPIGKRLQKSDGFCGYDWMISNILLYDDTRSPKELLEA